MLKTNFLFNTEKWTFSPHYGRFLAVIFLTGLTTWMPFQAQAQTPPAEASDEGEPHAGDANLYYTQYAEQAMEAYRKAESSKAISLMLKAYQLSPNNPAIINNLAACYIQQGVYFHNTQKDYAKAIDDYRQALFYLEFMWPIGETVSDSAKANVKIIQNNLEGAMKSLHQPVDDAAWHLKEANELRRKGSLPEAMVEYYWVTKLNPNNTQAWTAQGDIFTVRQKPDKAMIAYQKALDSTSNPSDALYVKLGTALLQANQPEKATDMYNKALAISPKDKDALLGLEQIWHQQIVLNPRNLSAHLNLGAVYQQLAQYDNAFAQYQISDRLSPNNPAVLIDIGSLYQAQGQLPQAIGAFDRVLQQNPNNAEALVYKADVLKQMNRPQDSEQLLERALQTSPNKKVVLDQLMSMYNAQGDPTKIKEGWAMYTQTFPNDAQVQYQAALALHQLKDYDQAVVYYQKAIAIDPKMAEAYANLGTALHALHQDDEAVKALKTAQSLNPDLPEVKSLIADLQTQETSQTADDAGKLYAAGNYTDALKQYQAALEADPKNVDLLSRTAITYQALKRYKDAMTLYDKALALSPQTASLYYYKATVYDAQDQDSLAKTWYEKALKLDPSLDDAKKALAALQSSGAQGTLDQALEAYNHKNYPQALTLTEEVLKTSPQNATAYYYKGLVYDAEKKLTYAQVAYQKAIQYDPTLTDALYALAVVYDTENQKASAKKAYQQFLDDMKTAPEDAYIKYAKQRVSAL